MPKAAPKSRVKAFLLRSVAIVAARLLLSLCAYGLIHLGSSWVEFLDIQPDSGHETLVQLAPITAGAILWVVWLYTRR